MKNFLITCVVWLSLIFAVDVADSFFTNLLIVVPVEEFKAGVRVSLINYWFLLLLLSVIYLLVGMILLARIKSISSAGISAIAFGLTYFFLVELSGNSMLKFHVAHRSVFDSFLMYGFELTPFVFIPMGVYLMNYLIDKRRYQTARTLNNSMLQ